MSQGDDLAIHQILIQWRDDSPEKQLKKNPFQENIWSKHVRIHGNQPALYYRFPISIYSGNSNSRVRCDLTQFWTDWDASSNVYVSKFDKNELVK